MPHERNVESLKPDDLAVEGCAQSKLPFETYAVGLVLKNHYIQTDDGKNIA
jgi:hypothetical protein